MNGHKKTSVPWRERGAVIHNPKSVISFHIFPSLSLGQVLKGGMQSSSGTEYMKESPGMQEGGKKYDSWGSGFQIAVRTGRH
jgi:hypothetical protein